MKATPEPLSSGSGYAESARWGFTMATAAGSTGGRWWWSVTITSIPRAPASAISATLVEPVSTVTMSVIPGTHGGVHGRERQAVALVKARRDVGRRLDPQAAERDHQLGEAREAIGIEVPEDHHALSGRAGTGDAREQTLRHRAAGAGR